MESISDSDSDAPLSPGSVSMEQLHALMQRVPAERRLHITRSLREKGFWDEDSDVSSSFSPRGPNIEDLFSDISFIEDELAINDREIPKSIQNTQSLQDLSSNIITNEIPSTPRFESQSDHKLINEYPNNHERHDIIETCTTKNNDNNDSIHTTTKNANSIDDDLDIDDANHLKAFLGTTTSHRRGLRQRTFTNAHPYLADSAQWMGLATTDMLNRLFDQNNDVEVIIKILNKAYLKNKKLFPKDYKFKSKNFYAFLGSVRQNHLANEHKSESDTNFKSQTNDSNSQHDSQIGSQIGSQVELSDLEFSDTEMKDTEISSFYQSPTDKLELSDQDILQKENLNVAHSKRYRKSKPSIEDLKSQKHMKNPNNEEIMQVSRMNKQSGPSKANSWDGFVDDSQYYEPDEDELENATIKKSHLVSPTENFAVFEILEKDSDIEQQNIAEDLDISDWDVVEDDRIDPMFANRRSTQAKKSQSKVCKAQNRLNTSKNRHSNLINHRNLTLNYRNQKISSSNATNKYNYKRKEKRQHQLKTISGSIQKNQSRYPLQQLNHDTPGLNSINENGSFDSIDSKSKPGKSIKDLLGNNYAFSRSPAMSTTIIEGNSSRKFVSKGSNLNHSRTIPALDFSTDLISFKDIHHEKFPSNFILSQFKPKDIHSLKFGYKKLLSLDSIYLTLIGEQYSFSLLDKTTSRKNLAKLLYQLNKVFNEAKFLQNASIETEIYKALKALIEWILIVQEIPDDNSWRMLHNLFIDYEKNSIMIKRKIVYLPYFLLLWYFFTQISECKFDGANLKDKKILYEASTRYFKSIFQYLTANELKCKLELTSKGHYTIDFESMYISYIIYLGQNPDNWWLPIGDAIKQMISQPSSDPMNILDHLVQLAILTPRKEYCWKPFHLIYQAISLETTSYVHEKFIEIVFQLKEQLSWPLEEKLITNIYGAIAVRKFSNFCNELDTNHELLGKVISRDSIPDNTFFDRFMYLLFSYVCEMPLESNKKRFISKLLPSTQYVYGKDSKSFGTFINRMNYILLLSHVSDFDLKNQFYNLIHSIVTSTEDANYFKVASQGCILYSDIAISKSYEFPVEAFCILMNLMGKLYSKTKILEYISIWNELQTKISHQSVLDNSSMIAFNIISGIDITGFNDNLILTYLEFCLLNLLQPSLDITPQKLTAVQDKFVSIIQLQMGRLPQLRVEDEDKIDALVEMSLTSWIKIYSFDCNVNWNEVIFQKYPYLGNHYSRNKFLLYFYSGLLEFLNISDYIDIFVVALLQMLTPGSDSKYMGIFFNKIRKSNEPIFHFNIEGLSGTVSDIHIKALKFSLATNFIENIVQSKSIAGSTKEYYLKEYVSSLYKKSQEPDVPKESLKRYISVIEKWGLKYVQDFPSFKNLARNLGLQQFEINRTIWSKYSLQERLRIIHSDIVTGIRMKKDCTKILDKYLTIDEFELLFHLISIYMKAIAMTQNEKWILLFILMEYLNYQLKSCTINITDGSLKAFLASLTDIVYLQHTAYRTNYFSYELRTFAAVAKVYVTTYSVYDGYKDKASLKSIIDMFAANYGNTVPISSPEDFKAPFSSLRVYDIQVKSSELKLSDQSINPFLIPTITTILKNFNNIKDIENNRADDDCLLILHDLTSKPVFEVLDFDLNFA